MTMQLHKTVIASCMVNPGLKVPSNKAEIQEKDLVTPLQTTDVSTPQIKATNPQRHSLQHEV
jgi:hypothetical protein